MRPYANPYAIRAGAQQFATASIEMRQKALKIEQSSTSLVEGSNGWRGTAAQAFHQVAEHLREDALTAYQAFERAAGVLNTLAGQLEQVNGLRQQADQLAMTIHPLEANLWGADDQQRASIQQEIASLKYRHSMLVNEADSDENRANANASAAFNDITALVHRLHVTSTFGVTSSSLLDQIGHFFNGLWNSAKDQVHEIEQEVEAEVEKIGAEIKQDVAEVKDLVGEVEEKIHQAKTNGGWAGGGIGFVEGLSDSIRDLIESTWKLSPAYMIYHAVTHWEETVEKLANSIYEILHPTDTTKKDLAKAKVIWSTVKATVEDSWERDIVNGNAYTRAKWGGYAVGTIASLFVTKGAGEVEAVAKTSQATEMVTTAVRFSRSQITGDAFEDQVDALLEKYGLTREEFDQLRAIPTHELSSEQVQLITSIREEVPNPSEDELMTKVIPGSSIEVYLEGKESWTKVLKGFGARAQDINNLNSPQSLFDALALGYENTRFSIDDDSIGVIRYLSPAEEIYKIPYGGNSEEAIQKMAGFIKQKPPFQGNGFTASINHIIPEFVIHDGKDSIVIPDGAELYEVSKNGEETLRGIFNAELKRFIIISK